MEDPTAPLASIIGAFSSADKDPPSVAASLAGPRLAPLAALADPEARLQAAEDLHVSSRAALESAKVTRGLAVLVLSAPGEDVPRTTLARKIRVSAAEIDAMAPDSATEKEALEALAEDGEPADPEKALVRAHAAVLYHQAVLDRLETVRYDYARQVAFDLEGSAADPVQAVRVLLETKPTEAEAAAASLAAPLEHSLWGISDPFARMSRAGLSYRTALEQLHEAEEAFYPALHVLVESLESGGEGMPRAPLARRLAINPRHLGKLLEDHQLETTLDEAYRRAKEVGGGSVLAGAFELRARMLTYDAARRAASRVQATVAIHITEGRYGPAVEPEGVMYALMADPDVTERLGELAALDVPGNKVLETLADRLAAPQAEQLERIENEVERLPAATRLFDDAAGKAQLFVAMRNTAVKVLDAPKSEGGEGAKKAPLARALGLTPRYFYQILPHTLTDSLGEARGTLKDQWGQELTPLEAALYAQARVLYWSAVKNAATGVRIRTVKGMAGGSYGRKYTPSEIARIGDIDSPLVTYYLNWQGQGARSDRIQAAENTPLTEPIRRALLAAGPDGKLSNQGENAVRYNTLKGMVNLGLGRWLKAKEGHRLSLTKKGKAAQERVQQEQQEKEQQEEREVS